MKLTFQSVPSLSLHIKYISESLHLMSSVCLEPTSLLFCLQATTIITLPTPITVSSMLSWPSTLFSHSTHCPLCLFVWYFIHSLVLVFIHSFIHSTNIYQEPTLGKILFQPLVTEEWEETRSLLPESWHLMGTDRDQRINSIKNSAYCPGRKTDIQSVIPSAYSMSREHKPAQVKRPPKIFQWLPVVLRIKHNSPT